MANHPGEIAGNRWNAGQYGLYTAERLRPAMDLLGRVEVEGPRRVIDLGCGRGEAALAMAARWPQAEVTGLDHSREMLAAAAAAKSAPVRWVNGEIGDWKESSTWDLVYSNAALHWLVDHETLFPRLTGALRPGGCLAVQMPANWEEPSHQEILSVLREGGEERTPIGPVELLESLSRPRVLGTKEYYRLLAPLGGRLELWQTVYTHILEGPDPVLEWVRGSALRPVFAGLDEAQGKRFEEVYAGRLRKAYPPMADGKTLFPFRRLFLLYYAPAR